MSRAQSGLFAEEILPLYEVSRPAWLANARAVALRLGMNGAHVSVDDVRRLCPPPPDVDQRVMGAVFCRPDWVRVGDRTSGRVTCHHRRISMFVRADYAANLLAVAGD